MPQAGTVRRLRQFTSEPYVLPLTMLLLMASALLAVLEVPLPAISHPPKHHPAPPSADLWRRRVRSTRDTPKECAATLRSLR
jgi:hypothetical protein